ncbi:SPX domain-containing protein 2-like [Solanum stenotomum]|uniref:SPX domain-containing protein 2-like n=1 Tax=Solanum stenotomum TaxID=172797 RepID=UPI0020D06DBA|nr:SPX domain-containing protein 2-like [Solanum stenotomum]
MSPIVYRIAIGKGIDEIFVTHFVQNFCWLLKTLDFCQTATFKLSAIAYILVGLKMQDDSLQIKILKKYDKRTDALIHLAVIQKVLEEPFFKSDVLNKLVKECKTMLSSLLSQNEPSKAPEGEGSSGGGGERSSGVKDAEELVEMDNMGSMYLKVTKSALKVLQEMRSGSSTVSLFSLTPMHKV